MLKAQWKPLAANMASAILVGLGVGGCATTTPSYPTGPQKAMGQPLKVILVETPMAVDDPKLRDLLSLDLDKGAPEVHNIVAQAVGSAQKMASADLQRALKDQGIPIVNSQAVTQAIETLRVDNHDTVVSRSMAEQLQAVSGADALLRYRITDYGFTPEAWRDAVIVFEITSTLGIAAIAYAMPSTRSVAGIYLVTEGMEESAEAYTGFWALDEVYRPVRIEAELIGLNTGTAVWTGNATGLADTNLSRLVRTVTPTEREMQLDRALQDAAKGLAAKLPKTFRPQEEK